MKPFLEHTRERIPQLEVLTWLATHHPDLHQSVELDRQWVWITASLKPPHRQCQCAECEALAMRRRSVAGYGFVFARHLHPLPSGKLGTWGHACLRPLPFGRERRSRAPETRDADAVRRAALNFLQTLT